MEMNGAEIIIRMLELAGVRVVAGIPGGASLPIYDALARSSIRHVLARHEQGAGFIAQGVARTTGRAGVALVSSGPGVTNLVTALADAHRDSIPLVAIAGQVPVNMIGTDAFQEIDAVGMCLPLTKHCFQVRDVRDLASAMAEAFQIAESGRPGPVLIDAPKDVQLARTTDIAWPQITSDRRTSLALHEPAKRPDEATLARMAQMIDAAERPLLYLGAGVIQSAGGAAAAQKIAERNDLSAVATLLGLGVFPADDPRFLGMLGMHGAPFVNYALEECDLLIAVGARFDDRATGKVAEFCPRARVLHVDIDAAELGKIRRPDESLAADAGEFLRALEPLLAARKRSAWRARLAQLRAEYPFPGAAGVRELLQHIARAAGPDAIVTTDVGQHQMWVAQHYPVSRPRALLTSGGLGTMGFGLPAALGAALALPERRIVCFSGDGSILMNIQELATLAELNANVAVIILNNGHLGLVRQQQELFYGERYSASRFESAPDFAAIARGFGVRALDAARAADPLAAIARELQTPGPVLIDVPIRFDENVWPMVPAGAANRDMLGVPAPGVKLERQ